MAFYTASTTEEKISDRQGGNYINESGVYDVILKRVCVDTGKSGAVKLHFFIEYEGTPQMLYNTITLTNNNGKENFQTVVFNKLLICLGLKSVGDPKPMDLLVGKQGAMKSFNVIPDIEDEEITLRIVFDYSSYAGQIYERKLVHNCFRTGDKASASEIVNQKDIGKQYAFESDPSICNKSHYAKGLTEAEVLAWKQAKANNGDKLTDEEPKSKTFGSEAQMDDLPF